MIIELLMTLVLNVFEVLTSAIDLPELPSSIESVFNTAFDYIFSGIEILANYTHYSYLITLFMVIVTVDVGLHMYQAVMYILKKIPMINIK